MLAALRSQTVFTSSNPEGSAFGAAALVLRQAGLQPFRNETEEVRPARISGLDAYRREWRRRVEGMHFQASDGTVSKEMMR
jgi:sugar (pentulose or hexulose) kinase